MNSELGLDTDMEVMQGRRITVYFQGSQIYVEYFGSFYSVEHLIIASTIKSKRDLKVKLKRHKIDTITDLYSMMYPNFYIKKIDALPVVL